MKLQSLILRNSLFVLTLLLALPAFRAAAQSKPDSAPPAQAAAIPTRITQAIDETQLVRLQGNVHPLARPEFDQGAVSNATPMKRMLLLLQRSPEQQAALRQFMDEQLSKESPNFHNWLTPDQFGTLYGPADADIQTVTGWLASHGFTGTRVNRGKTVIEFNGSVGQVRNAFHTDIRRFVVNGDNRQANTSDPQIPAALTPVVAGIVSLHNFPSHSMRHVVGEFTHSREPGETTPQLTTSTGCGAPTFTQPCFALGPADFAKIYNIPASLDGTGAKIAIVGFSTIDLNDAHAFRALFGLPVNDPIIVNNGPDPGFNGEEGEADLDVQWSGAVAPKAQIDYVVSEGTQTSDPIVLSAEYVIDNNSDDVMSLSFGVCEAGLGATTNAFIKLLWEQAAAQGITVTVSAGDNGTAGCDDFNTATAATLGLAVNGIASTPFNIAVGGTDFDDVGTQLTFWSSTNAVGTRESALGYIHEVPWNDSCAATATPANLTTCAGALANNIVAGSGGPSAIYSKPPWQNGITPNGIAAGDNHRYVPDVSLFASDGPSSHSFYAICEADALQNPSTSCTPGPTGSFSFLGVGGTSASAPSFAGIIALIGQSEAAAGRSRRQGNANQVLYKIASTPANNCNSSTTPLTGSTTCAFYDVTKGNNSVPCAGTKPNCSSTTAGTNGVLVTTSGSTMTPAFTTAAVYDLATGLGTVNVANLATAWGTAAGAFKGTTTTLTINGSATPAQITHGTPVTAAVTVAVVSPATGTPAGDFSILPANATANGGTASNTGTLAGSPTTITGVLLPGGNVSVTAHYAGDGTFAPSDSASVPITVTKENSRLQMEIVTFDPVSGAITSTNAMTFAYGSPYILRMDVLDHTTNACTLGVTALGCAFDATGTITLTDNGSPLDGGSFKVNSEGHAEDQPIQLTGGTHALSATYSGDISYNAVTTPVVDTVMVSKATTATGLVASQSTVTTGTNVTLTATISSASNSATGATGTVTFFNGGTQIGTPVNVSPTPATTIGAGGTAALTTSFSSAGTQTITATYNGDTNYALSSATAITITVNSTGSFTVSGGSGTITATAGTTPNTAMIQVTVTPSGGFTGTVAITCSAAGTSSGFLPLGASCNSLNITIPAGTTVPVTQSLTVSLTPPSPSMTASVAPEGRTLYASGMIPSKGGKGWWGLSAGTGLAAMILFFLPGRKRYRAALGLGLVCVLSFTLGCSSGYGGGGGGPVATTTTLSVAPGTKNPTQATITVTPYSGAAVQGSVSLNDASTSQSSSANLNNGIALVNLALAGLGTHTLSANFAATSTDSASHSGNLNVTLTGGPQSVAITGTSGSTTANGNINVTIN